jgi:hypothetical protein
MNADLNDLVKYQYSQKVNMLNEFTEMEVTQAIL